MAAKHDGTCEHWGVFEQWEREALRKQMRAALEAAEAAREPADYPNPGAHTPLRPEWQAARSQSALAAQGEAQNLFGWAVLDKKGCTERVLSRVHYEFAHIEPVIRSEPDPKELLAYLDREYKGAAPHRIVPLYTTQQPSATGVDVQALIEAVLPGGASCDPQRVADDIRAWFSDRLAQPSADDAPSPEPFRVGNTYRTRGGGFVRFVSVANPGKTYETMVDEFGVHRYTNRVSPLDRGRVTGMAHGDNSVVSLYAAPQADARDADTELLDWIESQYKSTSVQMSGIATYVATGQALRQLRGRSFRDAIRRAMGGGS